METQGKGGALAAKAAETQGKVPKARRRWKHRAKAVPYVSGRVEDVADAEVDPFVRPDLMRDGERSKPDRHADSN